MNMHIDLTRYKYSKKEARKLEKEYKWPLYCARCGNDIKKYGGEVDGQWPYNNDYTLCSECIYDRDNNIKNKRLPDL